MTLKVSTYCQACGVKFEYNADTGSDYYHGVSADCPNGHNNCCLRDKVDIDIEKSQRVFLPPDGEAQNAQNSPLPTGGANE